ncbi:MAG: type IX secretion system membrane protein PorP/SprF [Cytophagales bacterium]|nr:type IX secretion system membrane protein PorP/SprF [Cytophagales bacterium]
MIRNKIIILFVALQVCCLEAIAQQEFMLTHYMFNGLAINPAYTGIHDGISTSFLFREQWVGFDGAPSTQVASIHSPVPNRNIGLGALFYRDQLGLSSEYGALLSYAYRIRIGHRAQLSMGLRVSNHHYQIKYEALNQSPNDFEGFGSQNQMLWNAGVGVLLHMDRAYFGISSPQLLHQKLEIGYADGRFTQRVRHYYVTAGYVFDWGRYLVLKPNLLVKGVEGAPWQLDLNLNALINSLVWVGVSYRSMDSIDGLIGLQIDPNLSVSYATDFTLTSVASSSHEIMVNYVFNLPGQKILTPRYF